MFAERQVGLRALNFLSVLYAVLEDAGERLFEMAPSGPFGCVGGLDAAHEISEEA